MEVGAVSGVVEEFNVCIELLKGLAAGFYSHRARSRTLPGAKARATASISAAEAAAARLNRLLVLEMAPAHFEVLQSALMSLRLRTTEAVAELKRYVPAGVTAPAAAAATGVVAAAGRVSAESAASVTAAALAAAGSARPGSLDLPGSALVRAESTPGKGKLPSLPTQRRRLMSRPRSRIAASPPSSDDKLADVSDGSNGASGGKGRSASDDNSQESQVGGGDGGARAACWGMGRRVLGCIAGTAFSDIAEAQRKLLDDALASLDEARIAINAARRQVHVAAGRPQHYVRPPLFRRVVEALYDDEAKILVVCGAPALGKSALVEEVLWLVNSQNKLAEKFRRTAKYLCRGGRCDNVADLFRSWTGRSASAELSKHDIQADLADFAGASASLLVLDNLEDAACLYRHGALSEVVQRLGTSRLLITTCNANLCNVLPGALCFRLTRDENEAHVMFKLAARLARGGARRADAGSASPEVKESIRSCVLQCQGSPHLLKLVNARVRLHIMDPERRRAVSTLSDGFAQAWSACAAQLFPSAAAAQHAAALLGTYDTLNHLVYLHILRVVTAPQPDADTGAAPVHLVKAVLRAVIQLSSREWYPWEAVARCAADEVTREAPRGAAGRSTAASPAGSVAATPFAGTPRSGAGAADADDVDGLSYMAWSTLLQDNIARSPFLAQHDAQLLSGLDAAMTLLVQHGVLEAHVQRNAQGPAARVRTVRFHELLKQCLALSEEARGLAGLPSTTTSAAPDPDSGNVRQFFLGLAGWR